MVSKFSAQSVNRSRVHRRSRQWPGGSNNRTLEFELLEQRTLLSVSVPSLVDPSQASQLLFAAESTRYELLASEAPDPATRLFRFALDAGAGSASALFQLDTTSFSDAAVAIYDADGNLLKAADLDPVVAVPGIEELTVEFHSGQEYVFGVFCDSTQPVADFELLVTPGSQLLNSPITIDPASGTVTHVAGTGEDLFNGPADVDYYPLVLRNAGAAGTVEVSPIGMDVDPFVTIFARPDEQSPWEAITSGRASDAGASALLSVNAFADRNLTDAEYLLAVAPGDFNTAGGEYQVDLSAPVLGPATVSPPAATEIVTSPAVSPELAALSFSETIVSGGDALYSFRAPADATATLMVTAGSLGLLVSVYDETGTDLLAAASRITSASLQVDVPVEEGLGYLVRIGNTSGLCTFEAIMPYVPAEVVMVQPTVDLPALLVGPTEGAEFFRLETLPGTDVLVIEVAPTAPGGTDPVAPTVTLLGNDLTPVTASAAAGQTLFWPVDVSGKQAPYDLMVTATEGSDPVTVKVGQVIVPSEFELDDLPGASLDLLGDASAGQTAGGFGDLDGVAFYNVVGETTGELTTFEADGLAAMPLVAVYEEYGGHLNLLEWGLPSLTGAASLQRELSIARLQGLATISLGFAGGPIAVDIDGPEQTGVGVGMVPDPPPDIPSDPDYDPVYDPDESGDWQAELNIESVVLETDYQVHLWRTNLPAKYARGTRELADGGFRAGRLTRRHGRGDPSRHGCCAEDPDQHQRESRRPVDHQPTDQRPSGRSFVVPCYLFAKPARRPVSTV